MRPLKLFYVYNICNIHILTFLKDTKIYLKTSTFIIHLNFFCYTNFNLFQFLKYFLVHIIKCNSFYFYNVKELEIMVR